MKTKSNMRISVDLNRPQNTKTTKLTLATPRIINERYGSESQFNDLNYKSKAITSKSHGQDFFIQFMNKPQQQQSQFTISDQQPQDTCKIRVYISQHTFEFNIQTNNLQSQQLVAIIFDNIKAFEQKNSLNISQQIIGFKTKEKYFVVDYIMTKSGLSLQFLKKQNLSILPIFKDIQLQKQLQNQKININHFQILHMIGLGGFSKVFLARHHQTQKLYALKIIDKNFILRNQKQEIILNERQIMINIQHPFIVKMDYAFQTKNYLIFAMEFCPGGDFFTHLKQLRYLTENQARIYFLQICLALSHLHHNGIVYRDLKPENILIDLKGNMKIADFGLSKFIDGDELAYSFCGSSEYMSPEMIKKDGHGYSVDYYGLGALLYEMVFGFPPYYQQNTNKMFQDIVQKQLTFPSQIKVSTELKQFLSELLCKAPKNRLGSKNGISDIINHNWCKKVKLIDIMQKQVVPHLKPNPFIMYFEEFDKKQLEIINEIKREVPFEADQNFKSFYYEKKKLLKKDQSNQELSQEKKSVQRIPSGNKNYQLTSRQIPRKLTEQENLINNKKFQSVLNIEKPQLGFKLLTPQNRNTPLGFGKRLMSPSQNQQFSKISNNIALQQQLKYNQ